MRHTIFSAFLLVVLIVVASAPVFAAGNSATFSMDLTVDPKVLGSNVVSILVFNGPDFQTVVVPVGITTPKPANNWVLGDDVVNIYFPNKVGAYRVEFILNPFAKPIEGWYIGAQSDALGNDFLINPDGTIKMLAPAKGAPSILKMRAAAIGLSGKATTTWGNIKKTN